MGWSILVVGEPQSAHHSPVHIQHFVEENLPQCQWDAARVMRLAVNPGPTRKEFSSGVRWLLREALDGQQVSLVFNGLVCCDVGRGFMLNFSPSSPSLRDVYTVRTLCRVFSQAQSMLHVVLHGEYDLEEEELEVFTNAERKNARSVSLYLKACTPHTHRPQSPSRKRPPLRSSLQEEDVPSTFIPPLQGGHLS